MTLQGERRDIWLLAAGTLVSVAGDSAAMVALLLELRSSGVGWISAALGAEFLPFVLLASFSGRLVDRVDNRRLLVIALAGQALVAVPLAFARAPWLIVALFFALNAVSTMVRPAVSSMVPALSGEEAATKAFSWIATGSGIGWIIGPAMGGLLDSAFGFTATLCVDAGSFVLIAIACRLLSVTRVPDPTGNEPGQPQHGGMRILWHDTVLRWSLITTTIAITCAVVDNVAAPYRFINQLGTTSTGFGLYLAVWGVGGLAGSQLPRRLSASTMPTTLAIGNGLTGLGILGIGLAPSLGVALAASVVGGVGNGLANVSQSALVTNRVTARERGRAFASVGASIQTGIGIGTVAGAPIVAAIGAGHAMTLAGALAAGLAGLTAVWMITQRSR
jgi:predicted MFS family arabinose efflux permease